MSRHWDTDRAAAAHRAWIADRAAAAKQAHAANRAWASAAERDRSTDRVVHVDCVVDGVPRAGVTVIERQPESCPGCISCAPMKAILAAGGDLATAGAAMGISAEDAAECLRRCGVEL